MKQFLKITSGLIVAGTLLSGCITRGENFSSNYEWVQEKQTRKSEVLKALGKPYSVGYSSGKPTWTYGYYKFRLFGQSQTKELKFYWSEDKVSSFSFNSSFREDRNNVLMTPSR